MLVIEEERLALAEEPVEAPPIPVAERVQRVLNRRQRQDLCTHPKWSFRPGEGHCRHCRNRLDQYLFVSQHRFIDESHESSRLPL